MVNDYQPWVDFKLVYPEVQPALEGSKDLYLVVLVNSGAKGGEFKQRRAKIRETWASKKTCEYFIAANQTHVRDKKWILVFVLGKVGNEEDDKRNIEEAKKHNDMLIGDIDDNYLNNILKFYMGQLWASLHGAKYTLKTDDDVYVRIPKVIEYLVSQGSPPRFYGGNAYINSPVHRLPGFKWSISKKYFSERIYPPFIAGGLVLMSTDLLGRLLNYVHVRKPFHTDDAYVGVAMRDFKVKVINISSFRIIDNMRDVIRSNHNCYILKLIGYAHSIDPGSMQSLHEKLEFFCRNKTTLENC
ncbi:beta-1,3-galactosyltransferase 5-like [Dendronephthya gigantea]|uniref:beta-1,3-galactosyltransferase 5-like n=1 Tax=Dendronephthya gigantea TaxID=151771 RepID=UPI00106C4CCB|nr:beta-1,3-galactosyltransferase 5-like [Dendronephthya gigantea]